MADRDGRALLRDGPVRLADRLGRGRLADGPGDVPAGAAAAPARPPSAASPACCSASTGCSSCCPGWRCWTSSWRSSCSAPWRPWSTTGTGSAPGWRGSVRSRWPDERGFGPVRGLLFRPWLLVGRHLLRTRGRAPSGPRCTRWRRSALLAWAWSWGARRSFGVRWPVLKSALVDGGAGLPPDRGRRLHRVRRHLDRLAAARARLRARPVAHPVHDFTAGPLRRRGLRLRARRERPADARSGRRAGELKQSLRVAVGTTTTTSTSSTPTSSTTPAPHLPVEARRAGCC